MKIGVIYAKSKNNVIGKDGKLPWHLPEDLKHFKKVTTNCAVAMGRKTWESLPVKPLPGRVNIVISRSLVEIEGALVVRSVEDAIRLSIYIGRDLWFIGGESIIKESLDLATVVKVTEICNTYEGDTFVEDLSSNWVLKSSEDHKSEDGIDFKFMEYVRNGLI